jgi:hypothetical protein
MSWLNANGPAIQALATVASVLITTVLAIITARYVRLTRETLEFTKAQQSAAFEERRQRLLSLIFNLRVIATSFPSDRSHAEQIRHVSLWSQSDPDQVRTLAVSFGQAAGELAGEAWRHLATIRELAMQVQNTPTGIGVDWSKFPWERWSSAIQGSERCLLSVVDLVNPPRAKAT